MRPGADASKVGGREQRVCITLEAGLLTGTGYPQPTRRAAPSQDRWDVVPQRPQQEAGGAPTHPWRVLNGVASPRPEVSTYLPCKSSELPTHSSPVGALHPPPAPQTHCAFSQGSTWWNGRRHAWSHRGGVYRPPWPQTTSPGLEWAFHLFASAFEGTFRLLRVAGPDALQRLDGSTGPLAGGHGSIRGAGRGGRSGTTCCRTARRPGRPPRSRPASALSASSALQLMAARGLPQWLAVCRGPEAATRAAAAAAEQQPPPGWSGREGPGQGARGGRHRRAIAHRARRQ